MKVYITILLISLISCSNFIERQKRIQNLNLKSSKSELANLIQFGIDFYFNLLEKTYENLVYIFDETHIDSILKEMKKVRQDAESFLKKNPYNKIVSSEEKVYTQISKIRYNAHTIEAYITQNKFSEEFVKFVKRFLKEQEKSKDLDIQYILLFNHLQKLKIILSDERLYEEYVKEIIKKIKSFPGEIEKEKDIEKKLKEAFIIAFKKLSMKIDKNMPEMMKVIKSVFPKIKSFIMNTKKNNELKQKFKTFFIIKNIATVEDFDILIEAYDKLFFNLLNVYKLEIYKIMFSVFQYFYKEMKIFIYNKSD